MSKTVSILIEVPAADIKISKCGNYYNLPESVQINKMDGINNASAYIYRSRLVIKKGGTTNNKSENNNNNNDRLNNLEASVGKLAELMAQMINTKAKAKTKA